MTPTATTARATQRYLGWGRLAAGLAFAASLLTGVIAGNGWYLALVGTGSVLLALLGVATSWSERRRDATSGTVLDGTETAVFGVLLASGLDEQTAYVAIVGLLMLVLAGLRGGRVLRATAAVAVVAEVVRQVLGQALLAERVDLKESVVGLGLAVAVGLVVARMVDLARESERSARDSEAAASAALAEAEQAIGQLEAMHRVVASGIGEHEDDTLQRIVEEVATSVGLPYVSAVLLDGQGRPRVAATTEPDVRVRDDIDPLAPGPFTRGPLARALQGQATRANDRELALHTDLVAPRGDSVVHPLTRPDGAVIGALASSVPPGQQIDDHTFRTLGQLAGQTSLAIESARALRREADLAARYRDLDHMKTDFVAITSHELRTPLTTITGVIEMLERTDELDREDAERLFDALRRQTRRLTRLVDDLRTVSLVDAGTLAVHVRPTDVVATVRETVATLSDIETTLQAPDTLPLVRVDPDRLTQVVTNLLVNGDQHGVPPVHVQVTGDEQAGVIVQVWDQGPGIPEDRRAEVFERFSRLGDTDTHSRGSGLGLFIARQLTEAMGGTIALVDHPTGSAFQVRFPVLPDDH